MTGLAILALVPLAWAAAFLLIYRHPRRPHRRGGQRYVANPPRIRTQTTIPSPPPRRKHDQSIDERAGRTRTGE